MKRANDKPAVQLVWFKRDLRLADHAPLFHAAKAGPCLCIYCFEPELLTADDYDPTHLRFIQQCLIDLDQQLRGVGSQLVIRFGNFPEALQQLSESVCLQTIWAHEETGNWLSYQRDRRVRAWCRARSVRLVEFPSNGVVRRLASRDRWAAKWQDRMTAPLIPAVSSVPAFDSEQTSLTFAALDQRPQLEQWLAENPLWRSKPDHGKEHPRQSGGAPAAVELLNSFLHRRGQRYRSEMSSPLTGEHSCSRISSSLAWGCLSVRQVFQAVQNRSQELKSDQRIPKTERTLWLSSLSSFRSRLAWHCHFIQKLEDEPTIEFQNMNRAYDGLREAEFDEARFAAWCEGRTGYPMIDACMRSLLQTGWLNFRMRAMLVSFAAYHLWLHWERPARYLARLFLDYEPGIHYSQFQMQSGVTGINTIRIYSPAKQLKDQDPRGEFVRRYVPELADVPDKYLAEPHLMNPMGQALFGCRIGSDYPAPIVDHATAYRTAQQRIRDHKNRPETTAASNAVYLKHGSRTQKGNRRSGWWGEKS